MIKSFLAGLLVVTTTSFFSLAMAQNDKTEYIKFVGDNDPIFENNSYPEKLSKESAIILAEKFSYTSTRVISNDLTWRSHKRRKIVLLDKAAVEEFSYFYFQGEINNKTSYGTHVEFDSLQILIAKKNGTSKLVDLSKAVKVEKDVSIPSIFKGSASEYYQKIAIPDLEPGDIIDYTIMEKYLIWIAVIPAKFEFPAILYTLDNTYPTLNHKFNIEFPNNIKAMKVGYLALYMNTYNGAPKLQTEKKENSTRFWIDAKDLEKDEYERWVYPFRIAPMVKGQIVYIKVRPGDDIEVKKSMLNPVPFEVKASVTQEEIKNWAVYMLNTKRNNPLTTSGYTVSLVYGLTMDYLKKYHASETDPIKIAKASYYFIRNYILTDYRWRNDNVNFLCVMQLIFTKKKIPYTYVVTVPRSIGTLEEALLADEFSFMLKLNGPKPVYIYNVYAHASFGELLYTQEGNEAYEIENFIGKKSVPTIKKITLPISSASENGTIQKLSYTIDDEFEKINVEDEETIKGITKDDYYKSVLIYSEYYDEDTKRFRNPNHVNSTEAIRNKKDKEAQQKKDEAEYKEEVDARKEGRKNSISENFQVDTYDEFTLIANGRTEDKPEIIFNEKYKITGLLKKAGNNYLFEAGKLIGGQVEIKEKEMKRKYDVYMDCPRSFQYDITVTLPEGYTVKDATKLNVNVTNETGSFVTKATVTGNTLKISMSKIYNHNFEKKENWPKMVAFLDACYDFTQTKVLLVKK